MFLFFPKMMLSENEYILMCGFERFLDEEIIDTDIDVLQFILLVNTPVRFLYSGTSENRAWRSSFHGRELVFRKLFLIRSIKVPGYPSTTSRTISPLLHQAQVFVQYKQRIIHQLGLPCYSWDTNDR